MMVCNMVGMKALLGVRRHLGGVSYCGLDSIER